MNSNNGESGSLNSNFNGESFSSVKVPTGFEAFVASDFYIDPNKLEERAFIAKGNYGVVMKGRYQGETVAIKKQKINQLEIDKYLALELTCLKNLNHPNLLRYIGASWRKLESDASARCEVCMVTEFMNVGNLRSLWRRRMKRKRPLRWPTLTNLISQAAKGLEHLHSQELIHRDIKTENLLVEVSASTGALRCVMCDFGFTRNFGREAIARCMTICGTSEFMAPEVVLGEAYDTRADIYSFGIVMAELICRRLVGTQKFLCCNARSRFKIDMAELRAGVASGCPPALVQVTEECLTYDADERSTIDEIEEWLAEVYEDIQEDSPESLLQDIVMLTPKNTSKKKGRGKVPIATYPGGDVSATTTPAHDQPTETETQVGLDSQVGPSTLDAGEPSPEAALTPRAETEEKGEATSDSPVEPQTTTPRVNPSETVTATTPTPRVNPSETPTATAASRLEAKDVPLSESKTNNRYAGDSPTRSGAAHPGTPGVNVATLRVKPGSPRFSISSVNTPPAVVAAMMSQPASLNELAHSPSRTTRSSRRSRCQSNLECLKYLHAMPLPAADTSPAYHSSAAGKRRRKPIKKCACVVQ